MLNAEFYRTDFINQVIVDLDRSPGSAYFYNLKGKSYSNSFQIDLTFEPIKRLEIMTAYRLNDVQMTINDELRQRPLVSRHKAFLNVAYTTELKEWQLDVTLDVNGGGRLPNTNQNPEEYRLAENYPAFAMIHGQITKTFDQWDFYLGVENLLDYRQPNPILSYNNPNSKYFDSSMIWGPIMGRKIHLGVRLNIY